MGPNAPLIPRSHRADVECSFQTNFSVVQYSVLGAMNIKPSSLDLDMFKRGWEDGNPLTSGRIAEIQTISERHEQETIASTVDGERSVTHQRVVVVEGEPNDGPELVLAEVKSFDAVVNKSQVVVVSSHVADEGEEAPLRLAAVVGEEEGAVGSDLAPCHADGAGQEDGFRRQQEENLREDLFREVGDVEGTPPQLWRPRGLRHCHRVGARCTK